MKTIGTIFFLLWLSFYTSAQPAVDPETGLPIGANSNLPGEFTIDPVTGLLTGQPIKRLQGLDKMADEADLVFKGRVISTHAETNAAFPDWGKPYVTEFEVISILKGSTSTNVIAFHHITGQPMAWGGGTIPSLYIFEVGMSYVIFAATADKPDYLYSPSSNNVANSYEFRQPMGGEYAFRALDGRAVGSLSIKETIWNELNRLLNSGIATNSIYAIQQLNRMSMTCGESWEHSDDFKRVAVLQAVSPLVTNANEQVAVAAIGCFEVGGNHLDFIGGSEGWMAIEHECSGVQPECIAQVLPCADSLAAVANSSPSSLRRVAAIAAFSCTHFLIVSNSLPRWLTDPAPEVRAQAVLLLPDFPGEFCERLLQERAADTSPVVRAAVADAIGNGTIETLLPTLGSLFSSSPVRTNSGPWPHKGLQGNDYFAEVGADDIHTSAGYALLKFDVDQVGEILKANLSDKGFGLSFIRKLAPNGAEPYFPLLAKELKDHTAGSEQEAAKIGFHWPLIYWLPGNFGWAWDTLFEYVSTQPREALANPQFAPMLDALQIADDPSDARTRSLYAFFLDKGLTERAIELRRGIIRRTEDKNINRESFGFPDKLKAFDEMDKQHSLKPGLGL